MLSSQIEGTQATLIDLLDDGLQLPFDIGAGASASYDNLVIH